MTVVLHACPSILPEIGRAAEALERDDVEIRPLCGGPEAPACEIDLAERDDDLHVLAGRCPMLHGRLPPHLHVVDWATCYEALAPGAEIDRWLDEGAHLLTPSMLNGGGPPVWRRWGFERVEDAAEFAREGMSGLVYLEVGEDPSLRQAAERLADEFDLPLRTHSADLERLVLWLRGAVHEAESAREIRAMRRRTAENAFVTDAAVRLFNSEGLVEPLSDIGAELEMMIGASIDIEVVPRRELLSGEFHLADDAFSARTTRTARIEVLDAEGGFRVDLWQGEERLGSIRVSDVLLPEEIHQYRDVVLRLAPTVASAIQRHHEREHSHSSQELAARVFEQAPNGIFVADGSSRIVAANSAAEAVLGCPSSQLIGSALSQFAPRLPDGESLDLIAAVVAQGSWHGQLTIDRCDGVQRAVWLSLRLTPSTGDEPLRMIGMISDVTDQLSTQEALRRSQAHFQRAQQVAELGSWDLDTGTGLMDWSDEVYRIFGQQRDSFEPTYEAVLELLPANDRDRLARAIERSIEERTELDLVHRILRADGHVRTVHQRAELGTTAGSPVLTGIVKDISAELEAERRMRQAATVFEASPQGVVITDVDAKIIDVNSSFQRITGYSAEEIIGENPRLLASGRHDQDFYSSLWGELLTTGRWTGEIWNRRKDGSIYPELLNIGTVYDDDQSPSGFVAVFSDISEAKEVEAALHHRATHDPLTNLSNRSAYQSHLEKAVVEAERNGESFSIAILDLDLFKTVNDALGHMAGDELLQAVSQRLENFAEPSSHLVARLGGDEFAFVFSPVPDMTEELELLLSRFRRPLHFASTEIRVTASVGVASYPADGSDSGTLLRNADAAMYEAKKSGRNSYRRYRAELNAKVTEQLRVADAVRSALERDEFRLVYQPEVSLRDGTLHGCEALIRWRHDGRDVPPGVFIPVAEQTGIVREIGNWVIGEATRQMAAWRAEGLPMPRVWINVAGLQLADEKLSLHLQDAVAAAGIEPGDLGIEITETMVMQNYDVAQQTLRVVRAAGIEVALDDFGTGYSSLSYLKHLPVDVVKIDRGFVAGIDSSDSDRALIEAVLAICGPLQMQALAEGVETEAQMELLTQLGCHFAQGFHFARPMEPDALADWCAAWA